MKMNANAMRGAATICCLLVVVTIIASAESASASRHRPIRRAVNENSSQDDQGVSRTCTGNTPCKWEVYIPFSRRVDYVMKNTCECPKEKQCVRTDDDLSVSAYVHRCRSPQIS